MAPDLTADLPPLALPVALTPLALPVARVLVMAGPLLLLLLIDHMDQTAIAEVRDPVPAMDRVTDPMARSVQRLGLISTQKSVAMKRQPKSSAERTLIPKSGSGWQD